MNSCETKVIIHKKELGNLNTQISFSNEKACYDIPILQKRYFKEGTKIV
jgi:hypothetical protein